MKRIILYRYHNDVEFCLDRLSFIRDFNPHIPVYGLYGGQESEFERFDKSLSHFFQNNYCIKNKTPYWKWKNSDHSYRLWYKDFGHSVDFDSVIVLEWDLILMESVDKLYAHVKPSEVGMTGLTPLSNIESKWFWTRDPVQKKYWKELLDYVKKEYNYNNAPMAGLCPGVILPKAFLEDLSTIEIPELCHDELRLPLFAQVFGYNLVDLGFYRKWFSQKESKYFNCNNINISTTTIQNELEKPDGRRVFHPFREMIYFSFPEMAKNKSSAQ